MPAALDACVNDAFIGSRTVIVSVTVMLDVSDYGKRDRARPELYNEPISVQPYPIHLEKKHAPLR